MPVTNWLGRCEKSNDHLSTLLLKRIAATFGVDAPEPGKPIPALWHWCFFQDPVAESRLGADGHPARGGFLPAAENRNRMWAGGRLTFLRPLMADSQAEKISTITAIDEKQGRSGKLLFVTVLHEYWQNDQCCIREEQDIVYREPTPPKATTGDPLPSGEWEREVTPTPTLLFRYSAVTFNGHRIHYDFPYVTEEEGYPNLVVHGPLLATLNLQTFIEANPALTVRSFAFRSARPLTVPAPFKVGGRIVSPRIAQLWAGNAAGVAQSAEVSFE
ncbi:FAS1-like dehydratase domain-containing protein [Pseudomonas fluorescens]|uniref:FAS1-like dehydratase domain-containing protein n=1 Tax=Pseudomonas fluorescens TaxID=294 RepID=UPI003F9E827E